MAIQAKIDLILFGKPNLGFCFNQNLFINVVTGILLTLRLRGFPKILFWRPTCAGCTGESGPTYSLSTAV
jgi:hypothetical protein